MSLIRKSPFTVVGVLSAAILPLCFGCRPKPPDLTTCTRIQVRYGRGALDYFFPSDLLQKELLNEEERKYVRSYDTWAVTDQEQIKAFAYHVRQGTYEGRLPLLVRLSGKTDPPTNITGYRSNGRKISFAASGSGIITGGGHLFTYSADGWDLTFPNPPGLKPLQTRWKCGIHLRNLIYRGFWQSVRDPRPHLDPNHWCDTIVQLHNKKKERWYPDIYVAYIARMFTCPSRHAHPPVDANDSHSQPDESNLSDQTPDTWTSDYAMNSNCRADSPEDMVFLFESQPGWNQHGGPELFTFDNHDPKGGLVLLNNGTVKFIRTEEELQQLRWK